MEGGNLPWVGVQMQGRGDGSMETQVLLWGQQQSAHNPMHNAQGLCELIFHEGCSFLWSTFNLRTLLSHTIIPAAHSPSTCYVLGPDSGN